MPNGKKVTKKAIKKHWKHSSDAITFCLREQSWENEMFKCSVIISQNQSKFKPVNSFIKKLLSINP